MVGDVRYYCGCVRSGIQLFSLLPSVMPVMRLDRTLELDYTLPKEKKRLAESSAWLGNPPKDVHFRPESE